MIEILLGGCIALALSMEHWDVVALSVVMFLYAIKNMPVKKKEKEIKKEKDNPVYNIHFPK